MFSCHLWMIFNIMFCFFFSVYCFGEYCAGLEDHLFVLTFESEVALDGLILFIPREFQITDPCLWVILVSLKKKKKKSESPVHNVRSFSIYTSPLMTQEHVFISVSRSFSYFVRCVYKLCYSMSSRYFLLLIYMLKLFNLFLRVMLIISFSWIV